MSVGITKPTTYASSQREIGAPNLVCRAPTFRNADAVLKRARSQQKKKRPKPGWYTPIRTQTHLDAVHVAIEPVRLDCAQLCYVAPAGRDIAQTARDARAVPPLVLGPRHLCTLSGAA